MALYDSLNFVLLKMGLSLLVTAESTELKGSFLAFVEQLRNAVMPAQTSGIQQAFG